MRLNILIALIITFFFCFGAYKLQERVNLIEQPGATDVNPIRFYFMPGRNPSAFEKNASLFQKFMEEKTGLHIKPIWADDSITIVSAFHDQKADVSFISTLAYLMARDWAGAQAYLRFVYNDSETLYQGQLLARTDGPIQSLQDLNNKTILFSDPFSTSGYLYPLKLLQDNGIRPKKILFAKGGVDATRRVYLGEVDAAAAYYNSGPNQLGIPQDSRKELLTEAPDIFSKVKIVALTEKIPTGTVAFRKNLPAEVQAKLLGSLLEFARHEEGQKVLRELYDITGLIPTQDAEYDSVQTVLKSLGKSSEELVEGGLSFYRKNISAAGL